SSWRPARPAFSSRSSLTDGRSDKNAEIRHEWKRWPTDRPTACRHRLAQVSRHLHAGLWCRPARRRDRGVAGDGHRQRAHAERAMRFAAILRIERFGTRRAGCIEQMQTLNSREVRLLSRPNGMPTASNFTVAHATLEAPKAEEVVVRNLFMSVDPYMRGRMNEGKSYVPPFELGQPLSGGAVGEVLESRAKEFKPGDAVTSSFGWREYFIASPTMLHPVGREVQPLSVYLGVLGMTGMTAWAGLNLVDVKAGDVIFISGAAGAFGSVAGQLAKLRGCRVIGSAGSEEKIKFLREKCGFDIAFNYKSGPILEQLHMAWLAGVDVS